MPETTPGRRWRCFPESKKRWHALCRFLHVINQNRKGTQEVINVKTEEICLVAGDHRNRRYRILSAPVMAVAGETEQAREEYTDSRMKDAWLDGRLETAYLLNRHLNSFTIDTKVKDGVAYLSGTVEYDIDKDLAQQVALGIEGINEVENELIASKRGCIR